MNRPSVLVVGGGLAGITAALRCADRGYSVRLLEGRSLLGGATYSFSRAALTADTGQHVLLRCYTNYLALLHRLGVADGVELQDKFDVPLLSPRRAPTRLRRGGLPAPGHLLPTLLGHGWLTTRQRVRAARTAMALRRLDLEDPELDSVSFGQWLRQRAEPDETVRVLWGLLTTAALNTLPDLASLSLAARVFRTGVLDEKTNADIGIPRLPLAQLHGEPARRALFAAGVDLHVNTKVRALSSTGSRVRVTTRNRERQELAEADHVVLAVPHHQATSLLADLPIPESSRWSELSAAPIVNVHVHYDRPVTEHRFCAVVDSPVQWVFDRTTVAGVKSGQYLAISQSAAWDQAYLRSADLRARFLPALAEVFPKAGRAQVLDFFVSREPHATFHQTTETARLRPAARTAVPGLVLAGAWTATGWPDTLEGAVMSGSRAADVVELDERARRGVGVTA